MLYWYFYVSKGTEYFNTGGAGVKSHTVKMGRYMLLKIKKKTKKEISLSKVTVFITSPSLHTLSQDIMPYIPI